MKKNTNDRPDDPPSMVAQLAAAAAALGKYNGANSNAEHAAVSQASRGPVPLDAYGSRPASMLPALLVAVSCHRMASAPTCSTISIG